MKQLKTVFLFELKELLSKKSLLISTLIISLIAFGITFVPRIAGNFIKEEPQEDVQETPFSHSIIASTDKDVLDILQKYIPESQDIKYLDDVDKAYQEIEDENYETAFIFTSLDSYTEVKYDSDLSFDFVFYDTLERINRQEMALSLGIDLESYDKLENVYVNVEYESLGKNMLDGLAIGFVNLIALYILILLFGQQVATSVAREKDSRTMELLITSTNPKQLILGKVFAAGVVGVIEVSAIFFSVFIGYIINKATLPPEIIEMLQVSVSYDVILIYAVFSILGYLLYLFIFAALGSLVSKVEDVGSSVAPITIIFMIAYFFAITGMQTPDATMVKIGSYIPFISLFTTPIRYMLTSVKPLEILISLSLMSIVTMLIAQLSIFIYRKGSLNYGNKLKISKILKDSFKKEIE